MDKDNVNMDKLLYLPDRSAEFPVQTARIKKMKENLLKEHYGRPSFYSTMARKMPLIVTATFPIFTAATDGHHLFFNPKFADMLSDEEIKMVLAHEVLHKALLHPFRLQDRDPRLWNAAADYSINDILVEDGFKMPMKNGKVFGLYDKKYGVNSSETNYRLLKQEQDRNGGSKRGERMVIVVGGGGGGGEQQDVGPNDTGDFDVILIPANADGQAPSPKDLREMERDARIDARQAANIEQGRNPGTDDATKGGKQAGSGSKAAKVTLEGYDERSRADWKSLTNDILKGVMASDSLTYSRPVKKFVHAGIYLPTLKREEGKTLAFIVDVSGSINLPTLKMFLGQFAHVCSEANPDKVYVLCTNTRVTQRAEFDSSEFDELAQFVPHAGGGTDFREVMAEVGKLDTDMVIFFTDTQASSFGEDPGVPVIWAVPEDDWAGHLQPPYGRCIKLEGRG